MKSLIRKNFLTVLSCVAFAGAFASVGAVINQHHLLKDTVESSLYMQEYLHGKLEDRTKKLWDAEAKLAENTKLLEELSKKYEVLAEDVQNSKVIGFKNKNPGNIKGTGWYGQIGNDEFGHAIFEHSSYGIRALARVLMKFEEKGIDTIEKLVKLYAEGNQESYTKFLCDRLGLKKDETFSIKDKIHELAKCIIVFECGSNPYPEEYFVLLSWPLSI